jgi:hypothetical protein
MKLTDRTCRYSDSPQSNNHEESVLDNSHHVEEYFKVNSGMLFKAGP